MTLQDSDIYAAEIENWDGTAVQTIRAADGGGAGFTTLSTDTPPSVFYPSYIKAFAMQSRSAFGDRQTRGAAEVSDGDLVCFNLNGNGAPFDQYRSRAFDARFVTVRRGQRSGAYPSSWRTLLRSPMHAPVWNHDDVMFRVRDARKLTSVPLQTTLYAGTNVAGVGLEGTPDDYKGKPKPVCMGNPGTRANVSPPRVNAQQSIYQFADNAATVTDVRDGGYSLGVSFPLTSRTVPNAGDQWNDVASDGAGTWVAVGTRAGVGARTMRSTDNGVTWTGQTVAGVGTDQFFKVMYVSGLSMWVAGGVAGKLMTSTNGGVSWTAAGTNPFTGIIDMMAYSPRLALLIAGATNGEYATSTNGTAWTLHTVTANTWNFNDGVWGKDKFVVVGQDVTGNTGLIAYSADGLTYTQTTSVLDHETVSGLVSPALSGIAYSDVLDRYAAVSFSSPNIESSPDGIGWSQRTALSNTSFKNAAIDTDDGMFVSVGTAGVIQQSFDGDIWTLKGTVGSPIFSGVAIVGTNVVAVGFGGSVSRAYSSAPIATYASLADLQSDDPSLVPAQGTYKIYSSPGGSYFRLGSPAVGTITCDPVQGTTAADRTGAQIMVQAFKRAGLGTANLVLQSENFGTTWVPQGTPTRTPAALVSGGVTLDLIGDDTAGAREGYGQALTFTGNAVKAVSIHVKQDTSTSSMIELFDSSASLDRLVGIITWSGGLPVVTMTAGSYLGYDPHVSADNVFRLFFATTSITAANVNTLYVWPATNAAGSSTPTGNIYAGGVQAENRTTPSAYIPNTTTQNIGGDWKASSITALDAANSAEMGCWYGPDDTEAKCADPIDLAAQSLGAWWAGDANGVICTKRLIDPNQNIVPNPDTLTAGAGWTVSGSVAPTAAFSTVSAGRDVFSLTRLTAVDTGQVFRTVTLPTSGIKRFSLVVQWNGVAGTIIPTLYDFTSSTHMAAATVTWTASGTATAVAIGGTIIRFVSLGSNTYRLVMESASVNNAHTINVYATAGGTATSIRVGRVDVQDSVPVAVFGESDLQNTLIPLESGDENEGISPYQIRIQYARNYTVQTDGLDGAVSGAERAQFGLEWREAKATNAAVLTAHPLSQPQIIQTAYAFEADAQTEATRLLALKGTDREWYSVPSKLTDASLNVEMGDVAEVVNGRFGLAGGVLVSALGIAPVLVMGGSSNTLTTWR